MYQFIITLWILDISYSSFSRELDIPWSISYSGFKRIEFLTSRCSCHCSFFINKEMKSEVNLLIYEVGWFGIFWLVCSATFWQYCAHSACASYSFFAIFLNQVVDSWFIAWLISARWGFIRRVYHCAKRPTWVEGKLTSWQRVWGLVKLFHDGNDKIWSPAKYSTTKSRDCNHHGIQSCIHIYISWPHFRKKIINWVWRSIYMESTRHARTNYYRVDDSNTTLWKLGHDHTWIWIKQHFHPVLWSCEVPPPTNTT